MKDKFRYLTGFAVLALVVPAAAETIYSNLLNTPIPTTFNGVVVPVGDGTLTPFFGGAGVANNDLLQPFRTAAGGLSTIKNFAAGSTIDASSVYLANGYGGSQTHLGNTFVANTEGYLGFKLDNANYGWMRVVFTNNTGGAVVKDWAYDNSGLAIVVGGVQQEIVDGTPTVTLSNSAGETFTLGTPITGTTDLLKTGDGTTILTGTNSYSGVTTVSGGVLLANGSITGGGAVGVNGGATLGGTGSITGAVTVHTGGTLAPGGSIASLAITGNLTLEAGSTFAYEMNSGAGVLAEVAADFQQVTGNVTLESSLGGKVYLDLTDLAASPSAFAIPTTFSLMEYTGDFSGYFTLKVGESETPLTDGTVFSDGHNTWQITYGDAFGGVNYADEYYTSGSHFINLTNNLTSVPEPGTLLGLGCLVGSGAFLRNRRRKEQGHR